MLGRCARGRSSLHPKLCPHRRNTFTATHQFTCTYTYSSFDLVIIGQISGIAGYEGAHNEDGAGAARVAARRACGPQPTGSRCYSCAVMHGATAAQQPASSGGQSGGAQRSTLF